VSTDTMTLPDGTEVESLESFRERALAYVEEHIPLATSSLVRGQQTDEEELADVAHNRELQRKLFEGGLAGIIVAKEYGGAGLTPEHARVLNEVMSGRAYPDRFQVPTFTPCMAVLLEFGTEEQKQAHVPAILRGDEIWMQMLSEPGGGSDVAGAQTTAVRDGEEWVLNGSKIWTTGAWWADWALCLVRTNPDVPKHRGLSVFMVPFKTPGLEMHRIEMLNGSKEFCQEFMTDVRIPDSYRIGAVDDGWTVGTRWMFHERSFHSSPFTLRPGGSAAFDPAGRAGTLLELAKRVGRGDDPAAREMVGEAHALALASAHLARRLPKAMATKKMTDQAASLGRLMGGIVGRRTSTITWQLSGASAAAWTDEDEDLGARGIGYLTRQVGEIAGGTTEMARNVASERVLGMPRERTLDRDVPFREIPKGPPAR
jgi:alkylation response protein AidB-like acyl-CoA dehydrogenase